MPLHRNNLVSQLFPFFLGRMLTSDCLPLCGALIYAMLANNTLRMRKKERNLPPACETFPFVSKKHIKIQGIGWKEKVSGKRITSLPRVTSFLHTQSSTKLWPHELFIILGNQFSVLIFLISVISSPCNAIFLSSWLMWISAFSAASAPKDVTVCFTECCPTMNRPPRTHFQPTERQFKRNLALQLNRSVWQSFLLSSLNSIK